MKAQARALINRPLFGVAVLTAAVATALSIYVAGHPFIPQDAEVERDVQSTNWGPIALSFPFFSWIGDAKGFVFEVVIFAAILLFNRRAWIFAAGAVLSGGWYVLVSHLINRPRPTPNQVLRVTEHPGASSYPSGHTIFIVTVTVDLLLCRFLLGLAPQPPGLPIRLGHLARLGEAEDNDAKPDHHRREDRQGRGLQHRREGVAGRDPKEPVAQSPDREKTKGQREDGHRPPPA